MELNEAGPGGTAGAAPAASPGEDPGAPSGASRRRGGLCGNPGCGRSGCDQRCVCKQVLYCSRRCQKIHWGRPGGHKLHCTRAPAAAAPAPAAPEMATSDPDHAAAKRSSSYLDCDATADRTIPRHASVKLHGLVLGSQYNGLVGTVLSRLAEKGRYKVKLFPGPLGGGKTFSLKPGNLTVLELATTISVATNITASPHGGGGGGSKAKKGGTGSVSGRCANTDCRKRGAGQWCPCKRVAYCNRLCQKTHWGPGGHKKYCTRTGAGPATQLSEAVCSGPAVADEDGPECIICLDSAGEVLQRGCHCRGDAGLAHVRCLALLAVHGEQTKTSIDGWCACGTCKGPFTGQMLRGLAEELWGRVQASQGDIEEQLTAVGAGNFVDLAEHNLLGLIKAASVMTKSLREQGTYAEAERLERILLAALKRVAGNDDLNTLCSAGNLANTLMELGRHAEAELLGREVLAGRKRVLGDEHELTRSAASNLAITLDGRGKYAEAEPILREVLAVRKRVEGDDDGRTLIAADNLAIALARQGKHNEAEKLQRDLLAVMKRVLGGEHPDALQAAVNLGQTLSAQDKFREAEPLLRELLATQKRVMGDDHPGTLHTAHNLGLLLTNQRKFAEAEPLQRSVLSARKRLLGSEHPTTVLAVNNLAQTFGGQGKHALAESLQRKVLESWKRVYGAEHPETLVAANNLAVYLTFQRKFAEAEPLERETLAARKRVLGVNHPDTLESASALAFILRHASSR